MTVSSSFGTSHDIFSLKIDTIEKRKRSEKYFEEFNNTNTDFIKIFDNVIKEKKYDIVEEGDFYLKPTHSDFKTTLMDEQHRILGIVVQIKMNLK